MTRPSHDYVRYQLVTSYYDCGDEDRQAEVDFCIRKNAEVVDHVVLLLDEDMDIPFNDDNISKIILENRTTFKDAFDFASKLNPNGVNIVCNSDIYLDATTINKLDCVEFNNVALALSRWDINDEGPASLYAKKDSQDTFIFKGELYLGDDALFYFGVPGCDNRICEILSQHKSVHNPCYDIKTYHLHGTGLRTYNRQDKVSGKYKMVQPCKFNYRPEIKSVVHVALNGGGRQTALCDMLESFGYYTEVDWQEEVNRFGVEKFRKNLILTVESIQPDLVFLQIQTDAIIDEDTAKKLKEYSIYVVNWTGDVRSPIPRCYTDIAHVIDSTLFTNEDNAEEIRGYGANSSFLQIGYDSDLYAPMRGDYEHTPIVFMGNHYHNMFPLSEARLDMVKLLIRKYGDRFRLFGSNWPKDFMAENTNGNANYENIVYCASDIAINYSHFSLDRYSSDRVFRIMGSGAFCLTHYYPGIEKDFVIGKHLDVFYDLDDLIEKIEYYLNNKMIREQIALNGCLHVKNNHTWAARKEELLDALQFSFPNPRVVPELADINGYASQARDIKLSILIPTMYERIDEYNDLISSLFKQITDSGLDSNVEVLKKRDDGEMSIGEKRNILLNQANGRYVVFIDDDDSVGDSYVKDIIYATGEDKDCITFNGKVFVNGGNERDYNFSIDNENYEYSDKEGYLRPPGHLTPIKSEIAKKIKFNELPKDKDRGSDVTWAKDLFASGLVKSATHIDKYLYFYNRVLNK